MYLPIQEVRDAVAESPDVQSTARDYLRKHASSLDAGDGLSEIELDDISWQAIFQDIVRRSSTLDYIYVLAAFTCTKMRSDGFGGMVTFITADAIMSKSTFDILDELIATWESNQSGE